ncbi:MAG: 16S rRNA (guanine(966)-N(2))-methyltransferase RsmD [Spirochaetes bacterium GWD1_27_9]|nr:MAG: 16S rRNA (guanine(966)-N(2))-methyltransferase RsmD [Spirochaetes bacterium GWB1_27_13]OHD26220.1 MAG: 16S rRNA (guanine(966)-N(2))-methyltransferase RsmD [Spirochaetes bacterium GWC1_27_15]OHD35558.1 MAG: 16S rRNA (guanine(966)-N(2))-methyltransferase RsmD [Spirochaetes bacterium GWD1_27_9]
MKQENLARKGNRENLPALRVIAGKIKGRKIECPPGIIRPMTAKVRAALFNIMGDCTGMKMLDLFCGSGSISIEAFSRGMESSDLVDFDRDKKEITEKNLAHAGFTNGKFHYSDAISFCERTTEKYDFIMIDPPYIWDKKEELIEIISKRNLLKDDGVLVMQLPRKYKISEEIGDLYMYDFRAYGLNTLLFYGKKEE